MATQAEVREYEESASNLSTVALAGLVSFWETLDLEDAAGVQSILETILPDLLDDYAAPMAALAADWYEELREQAQVSGPAYVAAPAAALTAAELQGLAGWTASALYGVTDADLALSRLAGGFQRHVVNAGRDTIEGNVALDPSRPRFARHASANACAFCRMLATRGPVYSSAEAASRVQGRWGYGPEPLARDWQRRARGSRPLESKYHDHCRCAVVPVFPGREFEPAPYVADWMKQYRASTVRDEDGWINTKATLAAWREQFATH